MNPGATSGSSVFRNSFTNEGSNGGALTSSSSSVLVGGGGDGGISLAGARSCHSSIARYGFAVGASVVQEPPPKKQRLMSVDSPMSAVAAAGSTGQAQKDKLAGQPQSSSSGLVPPAVDGAAQKLPVNGLTVHDTVNRGVSDYKDPQVRSLIEDGSICSFTAQPVAAQHNRLEAAPPPSDHDFALAKPLAAATLSTPSAISSLIVPQQIRRPSRKPYQPPLRTESKTTPARQWERLTRRPYLPKIDRDAIQSGIRFGSLRAKGLRNGPVVYHVDFSAAEVAKIVDSMAPYILDFTVPRTTAALKQLCSYPVPSLVDDKLPGRTEQDIRYFCNDLLEDVAADARNARILLLQKFRTSQDDDSQRQADVSSLLFAREMEGHAGMGRTRRLVNFQSSFKRLHEDAISLSAEFTNCAGDIMTMTWIPQQNILCGTTTHSDAHNQQYNKPGNLLLCSTSQGMLRAFPDHRVPRPIISTGENSSLAMRQSQDPWLYSSVVSSDYDHHTGLAFTTSFDKTMKVWKVDGDGGSMEAQATFEHSGNVNFVSVAKDGSGLVATAADVTYDAVRVYRLNLDDMPSSSFYSISCSRTDASGSDKWAYFPSTMQWGVATGTQHLLLIGYSPRAFSSDEHDIPVEKRHTGEIMLWDARKERKVGLMTATTANVFEVAWHPTVLCFVVATSPCGLHIDHGVRTQVHVFRHDVTQHPGGDYSEIQKLDCYAADINEITINSNAMHSSYVTAACTDGKVYVWDMAQGDKPIHVLSHGSPLEGLLRPEDREHDDTGVKLTVWGSTMDRLYTGSSDGVVKVWNVRNRQKPFVRDLLCAPAPISCGSFSPDHDKLAIGDATGRLYIFSVKRDEKLEEKFTTVLPGTKRKIRRPKPFTPHPEPAPPPPDTGLEMDAIVSNHSHGQGHNVETDTATYARRTFLDTEQITIHRNPVVGAVQGPRYAATGLFLREAHLEDDPAAPLLARYERMQLESRHSVLGAETNRRRLMVRRLATTTRTRTDSTAAAVEKLHAHNLDREFDARTLDPVELEELIAAGALLDIGDEGEDWGFKYEDGFVGEAEGETGKNGEMY